MNEEARQLAWTFTVGEDKAAGMTKIDGEALEKAILADFKTVDDASRALGRSSGYIRNKIRAGYVKEYDVILFANVLGIEPEQYALFTFDNGKTFFPASEFMEKMKEASESHKRWEAEARLEDEQKKREEISASKQTQSPDDSASRKRTVFHSENLSAEDDDRIVNILNRAFYGAMVGIIRNKNKELEAILTSALLSAFKEANLL